MIDEGIHVTVENVGYPKKNSVLFDQEQFVALFDRLPQEVGCLIDTGHAMLNRWDIPALIRRMGTRIKGYHLNNNDGFHDSHYPIYDPEGFCSHQEMDDILRAIAQYTPQAHLVLEYAPDGRGNHARHPLRYPPSGSNHRVPVAAVLPHKYCAPRHPASQGRLCRGAYFVSASCHFNTSRL